MATPQAYLTDLQGRVVATLSPSALVTFGQHESNTIRLDDYSVSPQHGAIAYRGGAFVVERWSRGHIWINSQTHPVEGSRMLQDQDRLLIGNRHVFVFHLGQPEAAAPPVAGAPAVAPPTIAAPPSAPPEVPPTMLEAVVSDTTPPGEPASKAALDTMMEPTPAPPEAAPPEAVEAGGDGAQVAEEPPPARLDTGFVPAWARESAEATDTLVEAPTPTPPAPVPDWVKQQAPDTADRTPREGVSIPPAGWQQELQAEPPAPARATTDAEVWGVRQRSEARRLIQEATHLLRQGYVDRARQKLNQALRLNESNEDAWLWLAAAESDPDRRRGALQRVLTINPNNVTADWGLLSMQIGLAPSWQPQQPTPTPPGGYSTPVPAAYGAGYESSRYTSDYADTMIPALLRPEEPRRSPGRAWLARLLGVGSLVMLGVALFLDYGLWQIQDFALWQDVPLVGSPVIWTGLQIWGFVGIGVMALTALFLLLIRASGGSMVGVLLTIMGLVVIFMAVLPILFGVVTQPTVGAVVWGAAGLPLMIAGLLKIW